MSAVWVPWGLSRSILYQSRWWSNIKELDMAKHTPVSYPRSLATVFQFCEQLWWSSSPLSTGIHGLTSIPPASTCVPAGHSVGEDIHTSYTLLGIFTHFQWDALADIHGRSHSFPFIHPREVFLAWCWVITRPLSSSGIILLSLNSGVGLTGVGWYVCPILGRHLHIREHQLLMLWAGADWNAGYMNVPAGPSLCMRGHLLLSDALPHEACPPICPWSSSCLERCLPWLGWDCHVSNLWH